MKMKASNEHLNHKDLMRILKGSFLYEFDDMQLTLIDCYDGTEMKFDFENMSEEAFTLMVTAEVDDEIGYNEAMHILRGSKYHKFDDTTFCISDYHTGTLRLDLQCLSAEVLDGLLCREEPDNDFAGL